MCGLKKGSCVDDQHEYEAPIIVEVEELRGELETGVSGRQPKDGGGGG